MVPARIAPEDGTRSLGTAVHWHCPCGREGASNRVGATVGGYMALRITCALVALLVLGSPALAAEGERHSGRVVDVRPDGKLTLEEMGPWNGPGTGLARRTFDLAPNTAVQEVRPKG